MTFKQNIKTNFIFLFFVFIFIATLLFDVLIVKSRANMGDMEKGLIAHYPLNEEYGTKDVTPYGRHGANSGATLTTGRKGETNGAYSFDGADDYITINNITFATDTPYSISFWGSTTVAATKFWFGSYNTSTRNFGTVSNKFFYRSLDSTYNYFTGVPVDTTNTFHFYTLVCNGNGSMTLYRDNEIGVTITGITNTTITINAIGRGYNSSAYNHLGKFQDFRVYNRALSATEIKSLYETYQPSLGTSSLNKGLVAHYPLNEEYSTEGTTNLWTSASGRPSSLTAGGTTPPTVELINQTTPFGTQVYKVTIPANNATGFAGTRVQGPSTTMYYDSRPYSYFSYVSGDLNGIIIYPTGSRGEASCSYDPTLNKNEWKYYVKENTFDTTGGSGNLYMTWYASTTSTSARIFYIAATQIEQKNHATQFVSGTRNSRIDDKSGNGLHGTVSNTTNVTPAIGRKGEINGSYNFDGSTSSYITLPISTINGLKDYTISFWVNSIDTSKALNAIFHGTKTGNNALTIEFRNNTIINVINDAYYSCSTNVHNNNQWYNVVVMRSGSTCKIYEDKILKSSVSCTNATVDVTGGVLLLGQEQDTVGDGFDATQSLSGRLSDLRIYNRALSDTEVKTINESFKPKLSTGTLNKGLVLNMPLNNSNMQSATIVSDITPYENHGTINGGAIVGATETTFNGTSGSIAMGAMPINSGSKISISVWLKPTSLSGSQEISNQSQWDGGPYTGWRFRQLSGAINFTLGDGSSTTYSYSAGTLNTTSWQHVVGVWDGNYIYIYVNGVEAGKSAKSFIYARNTTQHFIGKYAGSAYFYNGSMSNLKIYNRALSASEVKLLYDKGRN